MAILLVLALTVAATGPATGHGQAVDRRVALTFDDLPMTGAGACDPAKVREVTRKLTAGLEARSIPAAGLASPGRACVTEPLLRETLGRWREIGAVIGNHSATHPDLNETTIEAYLADVDRGQALIEAAVGVEPRWFRPPYLHSGDEPRKKAALEAHLVERGYRWAPVTVDNQEWVYAAVYERCRETCSDGRSPIRCCSTRTC